MMHFCVWLCTHVEIVCVNRVSHTYWMHGTIMVCMKEVNGGPPDFSLDREHIHTLFAYVHTALESLRTMDACD